MVGFGELGVVMGKESGAAKRTVEEDRIEPGPLIAPATAAEGAELIRAFVAIKSPEVRKAIISFVQNLG